MGTDWLTDLALKREKEKSKKQHVKKKLNSTIDSWFINRSDGIQVTMEKDFYSKRKQIAQLELFTAAITLNTNLLKTPIKI